MGFLLALGGTLAALAACGAGVAGRRRLAAGLLRGAALLFALAFALLCYRFAATDTRLVVIADYSRRSGTLPFRVAGAWAGLEGSLLLWTALAAAVGAWAVGRGGAAVYGAVVCGFGAVMLVFANPFVRLALPPLDGAGITPILEHPAMLFHPLLVYGGLVALMAPFALALTRPTQWLDHARRWATATWAVLTFALFTGATWAYVEVGWGGYWAWDPVENGALIPWLFGLAFLHGSRPTSPLGPRWVVGLAGLPFVGVLLGATVTRSGWAASVHSFGEGRAVGVCFVALTLAAAAALAVRAVRATPVERSPGTTSVEHAPGDAPAWPSRGESGLAVVSTAAVGAGFLVALGTLWPFVAQLFGGRDRVVAGSFFAWAVALAAVAVAVVLVARTGPLWGTVAAAVGATVGLWQGLGVGPSLLVAAAFAALVSALWGVRRGVWRLRGGMGHAGFAVLLLGVAGTTGVEARSVLLAPGDAAEVGPYLVVNEDVAADDGPEGSTGRVTAAIGVRRGDSAVDRLQPSLVGYANQARILPETDRRIDARGDLQVGLDWADDQGSIRITARWIPLIGLVWLGALLLAVAALVAAIRPGRPLPAPLSDGDVSTLVKSPSENGEGEGEREQEGGRRVSGGRRILARRQAGAAPAPGR